MPVDNRAPPDSRALHVAQSADAQIIECHLHKPELLAHYVRLLSQPLATTQVLLPTRSSSGSTKPSKYLFNPTEVQQTVHQYLTPLKQQEGKSQSVFVKSLLHASAVRFQPHPGILILSCHGDVDAACSLTTRRLSLNDGCLQNVLLWKASRHSSFTRTVENATSTSRPLFDSYRRESSSQQRSNRMSKAVADLIHRHNGIPIPVRIRMPDVKPKALCIRSSFSFCT